MKIVDNDDGFGPVYQWQENGRPKMDFGRNYEVSLNSHLATAYKPDEKPKYFLKTSSSGFTEEEMMELFAAFLAVRATFGEDDE